MPAEAILYVSDLRAPAAPGDCKKRPSGRTGDSRRVSTTQYQLPFLVLPHPEASVGGAGSCSEQAAQPAYTCMVTALLRPCGGGDASAVQLPLHVGPGYEMYSRMIRSQLRRRFL